MSIKFLLLFFLSSFPAPLLFFPTLLPPFPTLLPPILPASFYHPLLFSPSTSHLSSSSTPSPTTSIFFLSSRLSYFFPRYLILLQLLFIFFPHFILSIFHLMIFLSSFFPYRVVLMLSTVLSFNCLLLVAGSIMFHVRRRPADCAPRKRKKKPGALGQTAGNRDVRGDTAPFLVELGPDGSAPHPGDTARTIRLTNDVMEVWFIFFFYKYQFGLITN